MSLYYEYSYSRYTHTDIKKQSTTSMIFKISFFHAHTARLKKSEITMTTTATEVFVGRYDGNLMGWEKNGQHKKDDNDFNLFCAMAQLHMGCVKSIATCRRAKTYVFFNLHSTHISSIKSKFILHMCISIVYLYV